MTAALLDLIDRIGTVIETDPDTTRDLSGRVPDTYEPNTLYIFPEGETAVVNAETGPPSREDFKLLAIFVADDQGEEPHQERTQAVTEVLSSRRDVYMARLVVVQSCDLWAQIEAAVDMDWTSNFDGRAVALRISGYRFL